MTRYVDLKEKEQKINSTYNEIYLLISVLQQRILSKSKDRKAKVKMITNKIIKQMQKLERELNGG